MPWFRRPSLYMLVVIRAPGWRRGIPVPIPLFVLDEVVYVISGLVGLAARMKNPALRRIPLQSIARDLEDMWYALRKEGAYTLMEISADDVRFSVKML